MGRKEIAKINCIVLQYVRSSNLLAPIKCSVDHVENVLVHYWCLIVS